MVMVRSFVFITIYFCIGCLGSPETCYYCKGTPGCGDPINYDEVSPRDCLFDSICLKYISTSKNLEDNVDQALTYRKCFQADLLSEDICNFVKEDEEDTLKVLNRTLESFYCFTCNDTNCNLGHRTLGKNILIWISLFLILLKVLI